MAQGRNFRKIEKCGHHALLSVHGHDCLKKPKTRKLFNLKLCPCLTESTTFLFLLVIIKNKWINYTADLFQTGSEKLVQQI